MKVLIALCLGVVLCIVCVNGADDRVAVGIPGGQFDITDEVELNKVIGKVTEHLEKLRSQSNESNLKFVKSHWATSQVVAGFIYRMSAEINENGKTTDCTISLWEKSWENFVRFDVECGEEKRKYQWTSQATTTR